MKTRLCLKGKNKIRKHALPSELYYSTYTGVNKAKAAFLPVFLPIKQLKMLFLYIYKEIAPPVLSI